MEKDNTRKEGWIRLPVMDDNGFFAAMNAIGQYFILYIYIFKIQIISVHVLINIGKF